MDKEKNFPRKEGERRVRRDFVRAGKNETLLVLVSLTKFSSQIPSTLEWNFANFALVKSRKMERDLIVLR